jgi:hypothetical protein
MSVLNDDAFDNLSDEFNELESKVLVLISTIKKLEKRVSSLEKIARANGIELSNVEKMELVEAETCTIN